MSSERKQLLTRAECSALRGIAIVGIFLHNYCHWLKGIVRENEYTFTMSNSEGMWHALTHPDSNWMLHLLSFFGHYGVPVFLFLSGYGLVLKYERNTHTATAPASGMPVLQFVRHHYLKLFRMMIVGFVAFTMIDMITPGRHHYQVLDIVGQLGMFNNLLPDPDHIIWPGPYWFFGLMMQLYIVYRLVLYRRHWAVTVALMAVCCLVQMVCDPTGDTLNRLRYNFIGGMLPFGMGLLLARWSMHTSLLSNEKATSHLSSSRESWERMLQGSWKGLLLILSTGLVIAFSFNYLTWFFVPVFVITASIGLVKLLPAGVMNVWCWLGSISAALFVCHPILRKIFIPMSMWGDVYAGLLLYIVSSVCVAWVFKLLIDKIPK
ncbi:MAG: acyltransferase [Prevotella sp.]|nr:acyltransferase [Prevotella sp.]